MANVEPTSTPSATHARSKVEVDPALLAILQRAGAPVATPAPARAPDALPGPRGALQSVRGLFGVMRHGVAYLDALRAQYGDVYTATIAGAPMIVVWDADEIHRILRNDDQVWSTGTGWNMAMFDGLDTRAGNVGTLLALDFDEHRAARKLVQPAFTLRAIEGYLAIADRRFAEAIPALVLRRRSSFKAEIRTILARVAGEIFTGIRDPEEVAVVDRALSDFWHGMMALVRNPYLSPTHRRARRGLATLIRTFLALVPERRRAGGEDLFSRMCALDAQERGELSDEELVRVFITIMFGAFDTTSAGLTSMAYLLAKHPAWQERLRDEARAIAEPVDVAATKSMKLVELAWKETLRLMPVNGYLPRCALRDVTVAGYALPAGALVMPMNGGIGRHPKWWNAPTTFDPERFSPERAEDKQHPGIFNPFGAGAHACVGMQLANMEMKLFWHRFLRACRFRLEPDYEARHTFTPMGMVSGDVALALEPLG